QIGVIRSADRGYM
ncbi:hypothetical protein CISIN_1g0008841mg, partial [Citrus sinensis]